MGSNKERAFGIWLTGPPNSGKSTIAAALKEQLRERGVDVAVLESDTLWKTFMPNPRYNEQERNTFYHQIADVGALLTGQGVPVIFDARANRRTYRERARQQIAHFLEVYVHCPPATCMARDPKGICAQANGDPAAKEPGLPTAYEPPETPEVVVDCEAEVPEAAARRVVALLVEKGYIR